MADKLIFFRGSGRIAALLIAAFLAATGVDHTATAGYEDDMIGRKAPDILSPVWLNTKPLVMSALRDKVVLVEFWTFDCFNCKHVEPYIKKWHARYAGRGLTVIGVHSPEFDFEREIKNVRRYVADHEIRYAVAIDNGFVTWKRYDNHFWPTLYLIDRRGVIRYIKIGEGGYRKTETMIQRLLAEPRPDSEGKEAGSSLP